MFSSVQTYLSLCISAEEEQAACPVPGAVVSTGWVRVAQMKSKAAQQNNCASAEPCSLQTLPGAHRRTAPRCSKGEAAAVNPLRDLDTVWLFGPRCCSCCRVFLGAVFSLDCLHFCQTPQCWFAGLVCVFCVSILGFAGRDTWCFCP